MGERQRNEKGQFVKGNDEGQKFVAGGQQSEIARQGGHAVQEEKKRKKLLREVLREELDKETAKGSGLTKQEAIVAAVVKNLYDKPNAKGLKILTEILGEMEVNVNLTQAQKPIIRFEDSEDE